jgi:hypothetical protein
MARKKSKSTQAKIALTRLVEDEQIQKQLRTGALRLREAYARAARRKSPSRIVGDKKIYSKLQQAGTAFGSAGRRLKLKSEPEKHTGRKVAVGAAIAGATAVVVKKARGSNDSNGSADYPQPTPPPQTTSGAPAGPVPAA